MLRTNRLVAAERRGNQVYYRLAYPQVADLLRVARALLGEILETTERQLAEQAGLPDLPPRADRAVRARMTAGRDDAARPTRPRIDCGAARTRSLLPAAADYRDVRRTWKGDLVAGVTVGIVALPLALAFGVSSGAGAESGLVTAIVAGVVAAVFGGSNVQVSGPTGAMVVVLGPIIATHGVGALAIVGLLAGRHRARRRRAAPRPGRHVHPVAGDRGIHPRHRGHHLPAAGAGRARHRARTEHERARRRGRGAARR